MALVTNSKDSLYGGINQQAAEHMIATQVEDCINATPTVNSGLLKRNPTNKLELSETIHYDNEMWSYTYDRGLSGDSSEQYSLQITRAGFQIIDISSGKVFNEGNGGILFDSNSARDYLYPFRGQSGYSALTIKDTTFILNKEVSPKLSLGIVDGEAGTPETYQNALIKFHPSTAIANPLDPTEFRYSPFKRPIDFAPYSFATFNGFGFGGSSSTDDNGWENYRMNTIITIDGYSISYAPPANNPPAPFTYGSTPPAQTYDTWFSNIIRLIENRLPNEYIIEVVNGYDIFITRADVDVTPITVNVTMNQLVPIKVESPYALYRSKLVNTIANFYSGYTTGTGDKPSTVINTDYYRDGFIWIKSSNAANAYSYNVTCIPSSGGVAIANITGKTTTESAAQAMASALNGQNGFTAASSGSVVIVTAPSGRTMKSIDVGDSFGNAATFAWTQEVQSHLDLPKNLGFSALVKVTGEFSSRFKGYWLKYDLKSWKESLSPETLIHLDSTTMPHTITRTFNSNGDVIFIVSGYDGWLDKKVGDDESNEPPSFAVNNSKIKDIFFFKNRLGFITRNTVVMSEVGNYGNFFRTTISAVLDSDRIDTSVDTTKAINLHYVSYLEDSLMLFSDKSQFKLEGGKVLSPSSIQVQQVSAYEMDVNIRPIFMNDKVYFCAIRGKWTAVMEYSITGDGRISEAQDITSHVDKLVPSGVKALAGSPINNMLFITTKSPDDTIFVYKYLDSGENRIQSAWFKWTYNGHIFSTFSTGDSLGILIDRRDNSVVSNWVLGTGIWNGFNKWTNDGIWLGDYSSIGSVSNLELQKIHPISHKEYFVDASEFVTDFNTPVALESDAGFSTIVYNSRDVIFSDDIIISLVEPLPQSYTIDIETKSGSIFTSNDEPLLLQKDVLQTLSKVTITFNSPDLGQIFSGFTCYYASNIGSNLTYGSENSYSLDSWIYSNWNLIYAEKDIGSIIPVRVDLGEWVLSKGGVAQTRGTLKMKTIQINSEEDSDFSVDVKDIHRNSHRTIHSINTVGRKPMIYGSSSNIRLGIINNTALGFRINSVSLEGNYNSRNKRI